MAVRVRTEERLRRQARGVTLQRAHAFRPKRGKGSYQRKAKHGGW